MVRSAPSCHHQDGRGRDGQADAFSVASRERRPRSESSSGEMAGVQRLSSPRCRSMSPVNRRISRANSRRSAGDQSASSVVS